MPIDPTTGQSVSSFDQRFAGFLDPSSMGGLMADQNQLGLQSQLAQQMMSAGYIPRTGFGGALAQMVQAGLGAYMLKHSQAQQAQLYQQQLDAINKAAQAKHSQEQSDLDAQSKRAISQALGINEGETLNKLKYAPQTAAADAQDAAAKAKAVAPIDVQKAVSISNATAGAADRAKLAQVAKLMSLPDSPTKTAQLSALLGQGGMQALAFGGMGGNGQNLPTGPDFLKTLDPKIAAQVKAIGEYRQAPLTSMAMRSPMGAAVMQAVNQAFPEYDATAYPTKQKARAAFAAGKEGATLNSLNTAIGHAGDLLDAADALNNFGGVATMLNGPKNWIESAAGSPNLKNFNQIRDALAGELTKAFRGSSGNESDIKEVQNNMAAAGSPEQLKAAIGSAMKLLGSKAEMLNDQYTKAFGESAPNFHDPHAKAALEKLSNAGIGLGALGDVYGIGGGQAATGSQLSDEELLKKYGGQ